MFNCRDAGPANITSGLDTLLLSGSPNPTPDIVALSATQGNNGIVDLAGVGGSGAFAVATVNVGAAGLITVAADTGYAVLPVTLALCQTDAAGQCMSPVAPTATVMINSGDMPTFAIFAQGDGSVPVPFDPANVRLFVRFTDASGVTRGSTSVAVRTQ
jgi:hypothetical protein